MVEDNRNVKKVARDVGDRTGKFEGEPTGMDKREGVLRCLQESESTSI